MQDEEYPLFRVAFGDRKCTFSTFTAHASQNDAHAQTAGPDRCARGLRDFGPWSKTPHGNTGNDISYVLQDTEKRERRGERQRVREREGWESVSGSF